MSHGKRSNTKVITCHLSIHVALERRKPTKNQLWSVATPSIGCVHTYRICRSCHDCQTTRCQHGNEARADHVQQLPSQCLHSNKRAKSACQMTLCQQQPEDDVQLDNGYM